MEQRWTSYAKNCARYYSTHTDTNTATDRRELAAVQAAFQQLQLLPDGGKASMLLRSYYADKLPFNAAREAAGLDCKTAWEINRNFLLSIAKGLGVA